MARGTVEDLRRARRVACFGSTGSGKSTLAKRLAEAIGTEWISADDACWDPGWSMPPAEVQRERLLPLLAAESWVLDTPYSSVRADVLATIDVMVALDYPRLTSLRRLLGRTVVRAWTKTPVCNGNTESWRMAFASRDSILVWHFRSWAEKRRQLREYAADPALPPVLVLRHPREAEQLVTLL